MVEFIFSEPYLYIFFYFPHFENVHKMKNKVIL